MFYKKTNISGNFPRQQPMGRRDSYSAVRLNFSYIVKYRNRNSIFTGYVVFTICNFSSKSQPCPKSKKLVSRQVVGYFSQSA